jgi:hypothetical protein
VVLAVLLEDVLLLFERAEVVLDRASREPGVGGEVGDARAVECLEPLKDPDRRFGRFDGFVAGSPMSASVASWTMTVGSISWNRQAAARPADQ